MSASLLKDIAKRIWIVILKIFSVIRHVLSMLWPDKSFSSRLCFGMAFLCTVIFVVNACFTLLYSCYLIITELDDRANKELKMAKMICDREQEKSDTTTTSQLFKMITESGIDSKYTLCITDTTYRVLASNNKISANDSLIDFNITDGHVSIRVKEEEMKIVNFNNTMNICLYDSIANTDMNIVLIEPLDTAMDSAIDAVKRIGKSSMICFCLLIVCYLVTLYMLRRSTSRNEQMQGEIDVAASIQKQMVPLDFSVFPESHGYDMHGMLQPAKIMGGDLLDFVQRTDKLFFCIGDVSGKGMPAALFMSQVHVLFHHILAFESNPAGICKGINRSVSEGNDSSMFCTLFIGVIDLETNILTYCNAGHNAPAMIDSSGKASFIDVKPNIALGLLPEFEYEQQQTELPPGTALFTYSDGVTEAESLNKQLFGDSNLIKVLTGMNNMKPKQLIDIVKEKVSAHTMLADQSDDITMLVVKNAQQS